jgi:hypothetical protein
LGQGRSRTEGEERQKSIFSPCHRDLQCVLFPFCKGLFSLFSAQLGLLRGRSGHSLFPFPFPRVIVAGLAVVVADVGGDGRKTPVAFDGSARGGSGVFTRPLLCSPRPLARKKKKQEWKRGEIWIFFPSSTRKKVWMKFFQSLEWLSLAPNGPLADDLMPVSNVTATKGGGRQELPNDGDDDGDGMTRAPRGAQLTQGPFFFSIS